MNFQQLKCFLNQIAHIGLLPLSIIDAVTSVGYRSELILDSKNNSHSTNILFFPLNKLKIGRIWRKYGTNASPIISPDNTNCCNTCNTVQRISGSRVFKASVNRSMLGIQDDRMMNALLIGIISWGMHGKILDPPCSSKFETPSRAKNL